MNKENTLQTLKDFEPDDIVKKGQIDFGVSARELKAEAIKRAKHFQKQMKAETNNIHKLFWRYWYLNILSVFYIYLFVLIINNYY